MSFYTAISIIFPIVEAAVLLLLLLHRAWRTLPAFCVYIAWGMISDIAYYVISAQFPEYYSLWFQVESIVDCALVFLVLIELAWSGLRLSKIQLFPHAVLLVAASIAAVGWALWPVALLIDPPNAWQRDQVLIHFQQTSAMLRVVFFVALAAGSRVLSITWKDRELQVASGLASSSIINVLVTLLHARILRESYSFQWLDIVQPLIYLAVLLYWMVMISKWNNSIADKR